MVDVICPLDSNKKSFDLQQLFSNKILKWLFVVVSSLKWGVSSLCGKAESTKQMEETLNFQVPAEGLELVI